MFLCLQVSGHLNFSFEVTTHDLHEAFGNLGIQGVATHPGAAEYRYDDVQSLPWLLISAIQSVACRGRVERVITSRRNDVFRFLKRVTRGQCSNSSWFTYFLYVPARAATKRFASINRCILRPTRTGCTLGNSKAGAAPRPSRVNRRSQQKHLISRFIRTTTTKTTST